MYLEVISWCRVIMPVERIVSFDHSSLFQEEKKETSHVLEGFIYASKATPMNSRENGLPMNE